ncbi:hypothetical protein OGAPHI_002796 [Ogataea philodendri]|uniref:2-dehydropantolactone reductase n=1 Tax=Ogataea philodendri TaxID=1378263 RepID=A0A9P8P8C0_9ASCO|nr:uncharacterized protein OGAPHI_002796 [Ogataea philodendri]KAH3667147.1 hypothetical protein OGAPHI_002796 [Ogataea philodendri]
MVFKPGTKPVFFVAAEISTMASISTKTQKLNTGASIPSIALGCWQSSPEDTYASVLHALKVGYRHIDTAHVYQNEADVGRAIRDSGVPRESIFVTTKVWNTNQRDPASALDGSLKRLGLDYVDLYLMHWPVPFVKPAADAKEQFFVKDPNDPDKFYNDREWDYIKTWELMQKLPKEKTRAIGVSNVSKTNLKALLAAPTTKIVPAANQIELHPYYPRFELLAYCKEQGIVVEAYSPLGSAQSSLLKDPQLTALSEKKGISPATLLISWGLQRDTVVLPKSVTPSRIESNLKAVELDEESIKVLDNLHKTTSGRIVARDWGVPVYNDPEDVPPLKK